MPAPGRSPAWNRRTAAARTYQPKRIRLLLLAESPPSDDRYFYFEDARAADDLFEEVAGVLFEEKPRGDKTPYLKELRRRGVFLVELKPDAPRDGEPLGPYVGPLLLNLDVLAPESIILIDADVYDAGYAALRKAGRPVVDMRVPFPSADRSVEFRRTFRQALVRAGLEKLIRPLPPRPSEA
jgi:hypothetical protein